MLRAALIAASLAVLAGGCGGAEPPATDPLVLAQAPYMGVACPEPNSIACDRVGLAIWIREPAVTLEAEIAGMPVEMRSPGTFVAGDGTGWEGYLQPARLRDGPLAVVTEQGTDRWIGRVPVSAPVRITARFVDGSTAQTTVEVSLRAGWG